MNEGMLISGHKTDYGWSTMFTLIDGMYTSIQYDHSIGIVAVKLKTWTEKKDSEKHTYRNC